MMKKVTDNEFFDVSHADRIAGFDGVFTQEIRRAIHNKRKKMGLSYSVLAKFFGLNWSTVRKWENGPTKACASYYVKKIIRFLKGEFDQQLLEKKHIMKNRSYKPRLPDIVAQCSERLANTYILCRKQPKIRQKLVENVVQVTNRVLENLADRNLHSVAEIENDMF